MENVIKLHPSPSDLEAMRMSMEEYRRHGESFLQMLKFAAETKTPQYSGWQLLRQLVLEHLEHADETKILGFSDVLTNLAGSVFGAAEANGFTPSTWPVDVARVTQDHADELNYLGWTYDPANDQLAKFLRGEAV